MHSHCMSTFATRDLTVAPILLTSRPDLPGSLAAYRLHSTLTSLSWPKPRYSAFNQPEQLESGLYTLELASCTLKDKHPILASRGFSLTLPTTSAIMATPC